MKKMNKKAKIILAVIALICAIILGMFVAKYEEDSVIKEPTTTEKNINNSEEETTAKTGGIVIEDKDPDGGNWTPIK